MVKQAAGATGLETPLIPVDSEHSALAQALRGGRTKRGGQLILTASSRSVRTRRMKRRTYEAVTPNRPSNTPWDMGVMVTSNSATMVNKALEVLEASLLFDIELDRISVTVHPQSMVHSMVQFVDGSTLAQASTARHALAHRPGYRVAHIYRCSGTLRLDTNRAVEPSSRWIPRHSRDRTDEACRKPGRNVARSVNAANEQAVYAFHRGDVRFTDIVDIVAAVVDDHQGEKITRLEDVLGADWARDRADRRLRSGSAHSRAPC